MQPIALQCMTRSWLYLKTSQDDLLGNSKNTVYKDLRSFWNSVPETHMLKALINANHYTAHPNQKCLLFRLDLEKQPTERSERKKFDEAARRYYSRLRDITGSRKVHDIPALIIELSFGLIARNASLGRRKKKVFRKKVLKFRLRTNQNARNADLR